MEKREYKLLNDRERFFWWNVGRRRILEEMLGRSTASRKLRILDIGCGPGGNLLFLKNFGDVTGLDSDNEARIFSKDKGFNELVRGEAESLPFEDARFDAAALLDVIEHIDDDEKALRQAYYVLRPGGVLLLSVPAYRWMWSEHDVALHHKRRYVRKELSNKIKKSGFTIQEMSYFCIPAIPFRFIKLLLTAVKDSSGSNKKRHPTTDDVLLPATLNTLLIYWLALERYLLRIFSIPFGSSLIVIAKKPKT